MGENSIGRILKALSGFYYVESTDGLIECRARGIFRKEGQSPLVGDFVEYSMSGRRGMVEAIAPRKNSFIRPAVSNVDLLVMLAAGCNPVTDPFLLDRVLAIAGSQEVSCLICVNKCDLDPGDSLMEIYSKAGIDILRTSAVTGEGVEELKSRIAGKTVAFTGNSGVGKSSLLNCIAPSLAIPTGEVSDKLGRGRHTTRHVELYRCGEDTYVADTPGFSAFDTDRMEVILKEELQYAFADFGPYLGKCQFHDCAHLREPGCAVTAAVAAGEISGSRYRSYERLYEKAKEYKQWEHTQP